ncbi:alanine/glycine:cation symporter family protein [Fulvivirga lutimaris]|uniref:alanine/glycine:cation symporter family protein n=1 Tax=Fulvivirga lutimaris TaxID=1819566 RepID=UPI0012BC9363|nr:alanine/glycine:cation symporter family protein [Fulvivirga lutimaris]MTI40680.1 alanine:cation symporter family protein [Fulvivirga lutimaris]
MGDLIVDFANWIWGLPLLILLLGGGSFFLLYSKLLPFKYFGHAIKVLTGKYDSDEEKGEINHYEALSTHLASTVGMGNIAGVAIAIVTGGPGAIFWMWVSAFVGIATKFFTCTLSIMYRGKDEHGQVHGGPMYVIREGLGKSWMPLAYFFCAAGLVGCLPIFQANQLTQVIRDVLIIPNGMGNSFFELFGQSFRYTDLYTGLVLTVLVGIVIFGGLKRIANVASKMVPLMIVIYFLSVITILLMNISEVPGMLGLIISDAFSGSAVAGGALGSVIITGARRAAFSNEAGIGTAPIAHGAAKTDEPVREGLVAMLGPAIDTLIVCTLTALAILITNVWQTTDLDGVTLTSRAFESAFPGVGNYILLTCIFFFASSSLFSFSWYGSRCMAFIVGEDKKYVYNYVYVATIIFGSVASLSTIFSLIDGAFALMAIPTMTSALILAPRVIKAADEYIAKMKSKKVLD